MTPVRNRKIEETINQLNFHSKQNPLTEKLAPITQPCPPPSLDSGAAFWKALGLVGPVERDETSRVYCNRNLNLKQVKAIGFDMDYTLAQYRPDSFEQMAFEETIKKLVSKFGYPECLQELHFDWRHMIRGLVIDKVRGNVLKVDRFKYVKVAYHGLQELDKASKDQLYRSTKVRETFDGPQFAVIDTMFSLAEAYIFMQLVEFKDQHPTLGVFADKSYQNLYSDTRAAVDWCHRDGSLKRVVASEPHKYIFPIPGFRALLESYRASGRKLFVATNSLWDYTNVVMNFLLSGKTGSDIDHEWLRLFDVVMTGTKKPLFFAQKRELFMVEPSTGKMVNTDDGAPIVSVTEDELPAWYTARGGSDKLSTVALLSEELAPVYQGGSVEDLHKMLQIQKGQEVLYVGDHIYGDILRSKQTLGWRTMLILPELPAEIQCQRATQDLMEHIQALGRRLTRLEEACNQLSFCLETMPPDALKQRLLSAAAQRKRLAQLAADTEATLAESNDANGQHVTKRQRVDGETLDRTFSTISNGPVALPPKGPAPLDDVDLDQPAGELAAVLREKLLELQKERSRARAEQGQKIRTYHEAFHKIWGAFTKTGMQTSLFAHQSERYACLYTAHVSNLGLYPPDHFFRSHMDMQAHEEQSLELAWTGEPDGGSPMYTMVPTASQDMGWLGS